MPGLPLERAFDRIEVRGDHCFTLYETGLFIMPLSAPPKEWSEVAMKQLAIVEMALRAHWCPWAHGFVFDGRLFRLV